MTERMHGNDNAYPVPRPTPRTQAPILLVDAVFGALTAAGFPEGRAADYMRLRAALTAFLYDTPGDPASGDSRTVTRDPGGGISVVMRHGVIEAGSSVVGVRIEGSR